MVRLFVLGGHIHFVSGHRKEGRNVLELSSEERKLRVAQATHIHMELFHSEAFNQVDLTLMTSTVEMRADVAE